MKTLIQALLQVVFLLFCICSCHNKPYPKTIQRADSIVNIEPDSAVVLLKQLKDSISSEPKSTQMYYYLLSIKARDKAYIPHTSDSLILQIVHYYENKEDKKHLPEAYYYAGRICRDLGDAPQALDYFQKAIEVLEGSKDYRLFSRIYGQMGTLYMYQDIYDEALKAHKMTYHYATLANDSTAIIFNLRDIGDTFTGCNNTDSALYYYKKAYEQAKIVGNQHFIDIVQMGLASLYKQLKKYDLARKVLQSPLDNLTKERQNAIFAISADLYYQAENLDSAAYYYDQVIQLGNIYTTQTAHWGLAKIAKEGADYQTMLEHINQYEIYTDSIQKTTNTEIIHKMQSLYDYQLRVKENNLLRIQNAKQELWIIYIIFALIILIAFIIIYTQYNKRKKHLLKEQLAKLNNIKDGQYKKSSHFIEANNKRIQELEIQLESSTEQNSILKALLQAKKEQIIQTNSKIATDQKEQELAETAFRQSQIYSHFHIASNDDNMKLAKDDWQTLQIQIDSCYKGFTSRLRVLYPVSDIEMQICLLLKANLTTTGIAKLTGRSKSAIVSARKNLYEKIYGEKGKPEQWDTFIASF